MSGEAGRGYGRYVRRGVRRGGKEWNAGVGEEARSGWTRVGGRHMQTSISSAGTPTAVAALSAASAAYRSTSVAGRLTWALRRAEAPMMGVLACSHSRPTCCEPSTTLTRTPHLSACVQQVRIQRGSATASGHSRGAIKGRGVEGVRCGAKFAPPGWRSVGHRSRRPSRCM